MPILVRLLSGRNGSTLMMELLGTSTAIAFPRNYPHETRYLTPLLELLAPLIEAEKAPSNDASARIAGSSEPFLFSNPEIAPRRELHAQLLRSRWMSISSNLANGDIDPPRFYAEKFGEFSSEPLIRASLLFRSLQLIRDPRDILASIHAFDQKRGFYAFGRKTTDDDVSFVARWIQTTKLRVSYMNEEIRLGVPVRRVRYEDLVCDLPRISADLAEWLGVTLDSYVAGSHSEYFSHHATSASAQDSIGRWKADLPDWEVAMIHDGLGSELNDLGYG